MPETNQPSGSRKRPADDNKPFSDASSTYWPEGWNWARFSHPDTDLRDLPYGERVKMFKGLEEVLGEEGVDRMMVYKDRKNQRQMDKKLRAEGVPPPKFEPDFLESARRRYLNDLPWGFIAFRTVLYNDEDRWVEFKDRLQQILNISFDRLVDSHGGHEYEEIALGRKFFTLYWIEDKELDGATEDTLRERYKKVKKEEAPAGMGYDLFLSTCPEAVDSVLSDPLPNIDSFPWRDDAPFLLVVMESTEENPHGDEEPYDPDDPGHEKNWYQSVFKVPVEIVPDTLWNVVEMGIFEPARFTRRVKGFNHLLGGPKPREIPLLKDRLYELWWGMMPSPESERRRAEIRGFPKEKYY
ncbi:hypothetical protein FQN49_007992 [Arthroderma sp. PD_2]|nr:hypothetical protein FQN49_007992 [Arthroderma sp. PD_2]